MLCGAVVNFDFYGHLGDSKNWLTTRNGLIDFDFELFEYPNNCPILNIKRLYYCDFFMRN